MTKLVKLVTIIFLSMIIAATTVFTFHQLNRGQTIDETLVAGLTSQLDKGLIDKVYTSLTR